MTAIYARQSVDKKDSISIDTQIENCRRMLPQGAQAKVYTDKGWSGKSIARPQFQEMLRDIRQGRIEKLIVYKLDRISRSLNDFSGLMELFKKYNVEFYSTVESFDTGTAIGRAMLGIIMVFAELERENILLRVKDNYYARGEKGMFLGGPPIYGFDKKTTTLAGIKTSMLIPNSSIETIRYLYSAYRERGTSLGELVKTLNEREIPSPNGALWDSCKISRLLRSPTYVCADVEVYRYFKEKGAKISNPVEDFTGERGCFLYGKRPGNERKYANVHDHVLSLGLHDGVISPELWLAVQRKLDSNSQLKKGKSGSYSWLTGMIKCGKCGYALRAVEGSYFYCSGKANHRICDGFEGKPMISDVESAAMTELFKRFELIRGVEPEADKPSISPKTNKLKMRLETIENQIDNLAERLSQTSAAIGKALEEKLEKLLTEKTELEQELSRLAPAQNPALTYGEVSPLLSEFAAMPLEIKRNIAAQFINKIRLWDGKIEIEWKF